MSELEYFLSVENIEISLYAQARQSLLLLTQGNIYNRLRFLNKYLMFLEELNELFRENWSKFLTAVYLVFWKQFPAAGYLDTAIKKHFRVSAEESLKPQPSIKIESYQSENWLKSTLLILFIINFPITIDSKIDIEIIDNLTS